MSQQRRNRIQDANWALRRLSNKAARVRDLGSARHPLDVWADTNWTPMSDWTRLARPNAVWPRASAD